MGMCYILGLVRDKPLGAPASVKLLYHILKGTQNEINWQHEASHAYVKEMSH